MIDNKWFCEPDDRRKTWCFLNLHVNEKNEVNGWNVGYGNPTKLLDEIKNKKTREIEIIKELLVHLYRCRKEDIILITIASDVLPILRTRILYRNIKAVSFYGLKYICIDEILQTYFHQDKVLNKSNEIQFFWNLWQKIGPLIPRGVL